MALPLLQIDAFTETPFAGNPAAVCLLDAPRDAAWMQAVAAEMNLSETAFVVPRGSGRFDLRWFTPAVEVDLCGHATLASAHALWTTRRAEPARPIAFETRSGTLHARPADGGAVTIDMPARPVAPVDLPADVQRALAVVPVRTSTARKGPGGVDYLVEVATEDEVRAARPDMAALARIEGGVILTARASGTEWDVASRYFVPAFGVDEDPVTGSAHCALAVYWSGALGRDAFVARQVSARGGTLHVRLCGDRVQLTGHAVTVLAGELVE